MNGAPSGDLSQDELNKMLSLLESLEAGGKDLGSISPELPDLIKAKQKGQPGADDIPTEEVLPTPSFVVKTSCLRTGMKVFINIAHSSKVPAPGNWANGVPDEVQKALETREDAVGPGSEHLRFPLSAGQAKQDLDRKGERCITVDCILNSEIVDQAAAYRPLKAFLVELVIGWVSHKTQLELDPKFKLPKMKYKGDEVEKQNIRVERKKLVCEVSEVDEEPSFALRTTKAPPPPPPLPPPPVVPDKPISDKAGQHKPSTLSALPTLRDIKCSVECKGRPADKVELGVILPEDFERSRLSELASNIFVEACGRSALIAIPGFNDLRLNLPYAVDADSIIASLNLETRRLQVDLNIVRVEAYLDQLREKRPLAFGDLQLHADILDLD